MQYESWKNDFAIGFLEGGLDHKCYEKIKTNSQRIWILMQDQVISSYISTRQLYH